MAVSFPSWLLVLALATLPIVLTHLYRSPSSVSASLRRRLAFYLRLNRRKSPLFLPERCCNRALLPREWKEDTFHSISGTQLKPLDGKLWIHHEDHPRLPRPDADTKGARRERFFLN